MSEEMFEFEIDLFQLRHFGKFAVDLSYLCDLFVEDYIDY